MIQKNERNGKSHIYLTGYIGDPHGGAVVDDLVTALREAESDDVVLRIDSRGGYVEEAWAMYNALRSSGKNITTVNDGFVASAAIYPYIAGKARQASTASLFFFHHVIGGADGYADDLRKAADEIDKLTAVGIKAISEATGVTENEIEKLMDGETWMDAYEAAELGIATETVSSESAGTAEQSIMHMLCKILTDRRQRASHTGSDAGKPEEAEAETSEQKTENPQRGTAENCLTRMWGVN